MRHVSQFLDTYILGTWLWYELILGWVFNSMSDYIDCFTPNYVYINFHHRLLTPKRHLHTFIPNKTALLSIAVFNSIAVHSTLFWATLWFKRPLPTNHNIIFKHHTSYVQSWIFVHDFQCNKYPRQIHALCIMYSMYRYIMYHIHLIYEYIICVKYPFFFIPNRNIE